MKKQAALLTAEQITIFEAMKIATNFNHSLVAKKEKKQKKTAA